MNTQHTETRPGYRRRARFMIILLVAAISVVMSQGISTVSAQASAPSCYSSSCEGLDPAATSCVNDAVTIQSTDAKVGPGQANYGHLEMRYSPSCHSNWVRYTGWTGVEWYLGWFVTKSDIWASPYIWREGVDGSLQGPASHSSLAVWGNPTFWSKMVTADGRTCTSVELAGTIPSESGYGPSSLDELGAYNAPCIG